MLTDDPAHHTRIKLRIFRPCGFHQFISIFYVTDVTGQALFSSVKNLFSVILFLVFSFQFSVLFSKNTTLPTFLYAARPDLERTCGGRVLPPSANLWPVPWTVARHDTTRHDTTKPGDQAILQCFPYSWHDARLLSDQSNSLHAFSARSRSTTHHDQQINRSSPLQGTKEPGHPPALARFG